VAQVADRKHGIPGPATTSAVRSEDWNGRDLSGERHERVAFIDVDLSETVDDGGVFTECAFRGARFNVSDLSGAWLHSASFTGCDLRGSDLSAFDPETGELKGAVIDPAQALVIAAALGLVVRED
jgi:uncharacterized protein YjbI with pentapeptide repeats